MIRSIILNYRNINKVKQELRNLNYFMGENIQDLKIKIVRKQGSYIHGNKIVIGVPNYAKNKSKEELLFICKSLLIHEIGHYKYTLNNEWDDFIKQFIQHFNSKYSINKFLLLEIGSQIINSIEDGRIEQMIIKNYPNIQNYLYINRMYWFKAQPIKGECELSDTLFAICTQATTKRLPVNYIHYYGKNNELLDMLNKINVHIIKATSSNDFNVLLVELWEIVFKMEKWLVKAIKRR